MQLNVTQFHIEKLHYYPVKKQQPMRMRPYQFNTNYDAIETVGQRISEARAGGVCANMLSGVASSFVAPSTVGYESAVNYEWVTTPRYIFMMKVNYVDHVGVEMSSYIIGYTDHDGVSQQGHVNPQMVHHINNIIETVSITMRVPLGFQRTEKLHNVYNTVYTIDNTEIIGQRPSDIYEVMSATNLANIMPSAESVETLSNVSTHFNRNVMSSANTNNITTNYLTSILNGGIHAAKTREITVSSFGMGNAYSSGADEYGPKYFTEPSFTDNLFVTAVNRAAGNTVKLPFFRFGTLGVIDRNVDNVTHLWNLTKDYSTPEMNRSPDVGEHWNGQDIVTIKAYSFIENCVAMATKYGFTKLNFIASNMVDVTGTISVNIFGFQNFLTLADEDHTYLLKLFETKFVSEIFLSETNNGVIPVFMECHVNLLGTSKVFLQYNGAGDIWYTAPTYSNSLYTPAATVSRQNVEHSAEEVGKIIESLTGALHPGIY